MSKQKPNPILLRIGTRLRHLRKKRGDTMAIHKKISKLYKVSLSQSSYSKIERGEISISLPTLYALADYFKVDPSYLLDAPAGSKKQDNLNLLLEEPELIDLLEEFIQKIGIEQATRHLVSELQSTLDLLQKYEKLKKLHLGDGILRTLKKSY